VAREIFRGVRADEVPSLVEKILTVYKAKKNSGESFIAWTRRQSVGDLQVYFSS